MLLQEKKSLSAAASVFLTNGRGTRTLKRWIFSYLAPLLYQQKKTLNLFFTLNNLLKSPNVFVFYLKGIIYSWCHMHVVR